MQRYKILHRTYYNFSADVRLGPHALLLRPREGPELRIESSALNITPAAAVRWYRDAEDNSVAVASFEAPARQLAIVSEVLVQRYGMASLDSVVAPRAIGYPFAYEPHERAALAPYLAASTARDLLTTWLDSLWRPGEHVQTPALLSRVAAQIQHLVGYQSREEHGVQAADVTLTRRLGSCRDSAFLFMEATRRLGFAARFVSGYSSVPPSAQSFGATHAWAEIYIPGAGWIGFDPSIGTLAGPGHIAVAVARSPELVPPVAGTFSGSATANLDVGVWVNPVT